MYSFIAFNKRAVLDTPESPGVYLFSDLNKKFHYVGKAINLKNRLYSYTLKTLGEKTKSLISETSYFSFIKVNSEVEALLLEAKLIRIFNTKYNSALKDDKHPLYIIITNDKYPQVLTARKKDISENIIYYGPFPSSSNVKTVLAMIRKIFPFAQHKLGKNVCLYYQLGLCNPCPNKIEFMDNTKLKRIYIGRYRKNITYVKKFLAGNFKSIKNQLTKEMVRVSGDQQFETAKELRDKLKSIDYITQNITEANEFINNPNLIEDIRASELAELETILKKYLPNITKLHRVECYDISHLSGKFTTASMVTFLDGEPSKINYRHFRIRQQKGNDDIASMAEVAQRRKKHLSDWGTPDLIIVDGGRNQIKQFIESYKDFSIPIIGIEKRHETIVLQSEINSITRYVSVRLKPGHSKNLIQRIRNEAHRFTRVYHHKLFKKDLLKS